LTGNLPGGGVNYHYFELDETYNSYSDTLTEREGYVAYDPKFDDYVGGGNRCPVVFEISQELDIPKLKIRAWAYY
jgi:hypothetical protein